MVGAAFGGLGKTGGLLGEGIKCNSMFGKFIRGTAVATRMVSIGMDGFDTIALVDKTFGKGNIAELNAKLHKSDAYNFFQLGVNVVAVLTVAMTSTMSCFVAGTLVMTAAGVLAIERIKAGDVVLSAHQETFEVGHRKVLETYVREVDRLVHLVVNGETIITTFDHPFYVKDQGFMPATNLWIGAELIDRDDNILHVEEIYHECLEDETCTVYNFQVEEYHTYFVGEQGILVHNAEYTGEVPNQPKTDVNGKDVEGGSSTEVIMPSKPHTNGTQGHWETILDEVDIMKNSGDYSKIYVNKGLSNEIPGAKPNRRPDIMGVRKDGLIDQVEVPSKTDDLLALRNRMKDNQQPLCCRSTGRG